jgi:hypothetical protein
VNEFRQPTRQEPTRDGPTTVTFRAIRRTPQGAEEIEEREVHCQSAAEVHELLAGAREMTLPPPPADDLDERWQETLGAVRSWLGSLRLYLERTVDQGGTTRWIFGWTPETADGSADSERESRHGTDASTSREPSTGERIELGEGERGGSIALSGAVEGTVHTGPDGLELVSRRAGQNVQIVNSGLCTWQTNNIICQVQMNLNLVVQTPER